MYLFNGYNTCTVVFGKPPRKMKIATSDES